MAAQTSNLTDAAIRLGPVLAIFDHRLTETLACILGWKFNILYDASRSMVLEHGSGERAITRLRFKTPSDRIFDLDLESHYRWIQTDPDYLAWKSQGDPVERLLNADSDEDAEAIPLLFWEWKRLEWPQTLLMQMKLDDVFQDSEIDPTVTEMDIIIEFRDKLEKHIRLLSQARQQLRNLIREKLSIDDVLYVSSKLENWRGA